MDIQNQSIIDNIVQIATDKTMIADGPLSQQCAQALYEVYGKERDEQSGITLETQANDALVEAGVWEAASDLRQELSEAGQTVGMIYGVKKSDVGMSDIVKVTDNVSEMEPEQRAQTVLFIDGKIDETTGKETSEWLPVLESFAQKHGIRIINDLKDLKQKD